ncbi:Hsp33 family molecular chaperone HslO [Legionella fairfieldensis]|uniref:Hsp33 family molecular chaperone HslO n=1 Tax=Legionella fairfieldensis TaxID=45064 RepID=UPI000492203D|nr:Hsp33 family molecular chaperone HslO [Legionella fairfieldensis]
MKQTDSLQPFMFEHANIRGQIVHIQDSYQAIINQHPYPPMIKYLLGEALASCLLLTGSVKFEGELSLQFQGDKRFPLLLIQCDNQLSLRGLAAYQENLETQDYAEAFIKGRMVLTINQYNQTQAYQSIVPIQSTSMSENLMHYFAQSEQVATKVWLAVGDERAAGMLLQLMPGQDSMQREQFWEYAVQLGQTVREEELLDLDNEALLHRLYHETELRLFERRSVRFQCRCNEAKMKEILRVLGEKEANNLLKERGKIEIGCDFCNKHYSYDAIDMAMLFRQ